jgi:glycosyltransferase involved in cell wall biosynthesis
MPKVALMCYFIGPKLGVGQYLEQLLPELVETLLKQNVKITLVSSPNAVSMTSALQKLSENVNVLKSLDSPPFQRWVWFLSRFKTYCKQKEIDIVVWLTNPLILPWHPPSIAVIHDVNEWKIPNKYGSRLNTILRSLLYLDCSLQFSKKVIVVSQSTELDLRKFRPHIQLSKISTIVNGSNTSLIHQAAKTNRPENPILLSVGRIDPIGKRLFEAVKLTSLMRDKSSIPWELHLVGGMNVSTRKAGEDFLESIKGISWVYYHSYVSDVELAQWFHKSSAVVFLSDHEGFGMPIAEASAFHRWAIVSKKNTAAVESGGASILAIDLEILDQEANKVVEHIKHNPIPPINMNSNINSWKDAAEKYSQEITRVLLSFSKK